MRRPCARTVQLESSARRTRHLTVLYVRKEATPRYPLPLAKLALPEPFLPLAKAAHALTATLEVTLPSDRPHAQLAMLGNTAGLLLVPALRASRVRCLLRDQQRARIARPERSLTGTDLATVPAALRVRIVATLRRRVFPAQQALTLQSWSRRRA